MSLKAVLILGPKTKVESLKDGFERVIKLYQKEGYLVIGDGKRALNEGEISLFLKNQIDSNTRLDINAHGNFYHGHYMHIFDSPSETAEFFKMLKVISDSKSLNIHLWSCYGKYALSNIGYLPKNSVLTVHAGYKETLIQLKDFVFEKAIIKLQSSAVPGEKYFEPEETPYSLKNSLQKLFSKIVGFDGFTISTDTAVQSSNFAMSPFQSYLNDMIESIEESHIITKIGNKIHEFSIIPQTREILMDPESFLNNKTSDFIEFYQNLYYQHKSGSNSYIRKKTLIIPNFTEQEIDDFRLGSFIANCNKNYQIIENSDLFQNNATDLNVVNKDINSMTSFFAASENSNIDTMKLLLAHGADIDKTLYNGDTALHIASLNGRVGVVKLLLEHKAEINKVNNNGVTPLFTATQYGHVDAVKLLIEHGADVNIARDNGATALFMASQEGYVDVVNLLLAAGADVNKAIDDGSTPLYMASQNGLTDVVDLLLAAGAKVNKVGNSGESPLFIASQKGHTDIAKILLKNGADVDKARDDMVTSLMIASNNGDYDTASALLKCGANPNKISSYGTALELAKSQQHQSVIKLFVDFASGKIKYSPQDCSSYHHNLEVPPTGEMEDNIYHNEL